MHRIDVRHLYSDPDRRTQRQILRITEQSQHINILIFSLTQYRCHFPLSLSLSLNLRFLRDPPFRIFAVRVSQVSGPRRFLVGGYLIDNTESNPTVYSAVHLPSTSPKRQQWKKKAKDVRRGEIELKET